MRVLLHLSRTIGLHLGLGRPRTPSTLQPAPMIEQTVLRELHDVHLDRNGDRPASPVYGETHVVERHGSRRPSAQDRPPCP
ncbi:MAG: hypothetical protein U5K74_06150 [Gemmatimonadaceae bacterium]|nr:hypothetical protein [Gemmatimonadaceae bacterium]